MKKIAAVSLSALVFLSPALPVLAETNPKTLKAESKDSTVQAGKENEEAVKEIKIETAQDFIDQFAGVWIFPDKDAENKDNSKNNDNKEFIWFEKADESNYEAILKGEEVYQTLPEELQKEIADAYTKQKISRDQLILDAQGLKEKAEEADRKAQEEKEAADREAAEKAAAEKEKQEKEQQAKDAAAKAPEQNQPADSAQSVPAVIPDVKPAQENSSEASASSQNPAAPQTVQPQDDAKQNSEEKNTQSSPVQSDPASPAGTQNSTENQKTGQDSTAGNESQDSQETEQSDTEKAADDQNAADADGAAAASETVLYQASLPAGKLGNIPVQAAGLSADLSEKENSAIYEAVSKNLEENGKSADSAALYDSVRFSSSSKDMSASSEEMMALKASEETVFFTATVSDDARTVQVQPYNPKAVSVSYNTGQITVEKSKAYTVSLDQETVDDTKVPEDKTDQNASGESASAEGAGAGTETEQPAAPEAEQNKDTESENGQQEPGDVSDPADLKDRTAFIGQSSNDNSEQAGGIGSIGLVQSVSEQLNSALESSRVAQNTPESSNQLASQNLEPQNLQLMNASDFVRNYCSNASGQIYLQVWSANYRQIMAGYSQWRTMSASEKAAVNSQLQSVGSSTYLTLYRQAHRVMLGLGVTSGTGQVARPSFSSKVPTATDSHGMLWSMAAALFGFLTILFGFRSFRKEDPSAQEE